MAPRPRPLTFQAATGRVACEKTIASKTLIWPSGGESENSRSSNRRAQLKDFSQHIPQSTTSSISSST